MPTNILQEIIGLLSQGAYGKLGEDIFVGHMPPNPDNMTMLMASGGAEQDKYLDTNYAYIDIWTRNRHSDDGYNRLLQIYTALQRTQNVQLNRFYLYFLSATTNILDMDRDSQGRKLYKITFQAIYRDTNVVS